MPVAPTERRRRTPVSGASLPREPQARLRAHPDGLRREPDGPGPTDAALAVWRQVLENHSYARARVQLAELYLTTNQPDLAQAQLREVLSDDAHAPAFQRKRDRVWLRKAKKLLRP